jgi:uncharacterized Zn finger protein
MKVDCISCGHEVDLNHDVFRDYEGSVKCFCCGTMMDIATSEGMLHSISLPRDSKNIHADKTSRRAHTL